MYRFRKFLIPLFSILLLFSAFSEEKSSGENDISNVLMSHVLDSKEWHPLPFIGPIHLSSIHAGIYTIPFTKHILMMLIVVGILFGLFIPAFARVKIVPNKIGSFLEPLVLFVRDDVVYPAMGEELGKKWLPFFFTQFFFILTANVIGLVPVFGTLTGNLSITIALALMILLAIFIQGIARLGIGGFLHTMIPEGLPIPLAIFIFILEFAGIFIRSSVLAIRLFANMIAGHLVIGTLLILIFIIHPLAAVVSVPMAIFINLLEVLVVFIQAFVFTLLSAIFIGMASTHH